MTPTDFANTYLETANDVSRGTGINLGALLAQWGVETAWGSEIFNLNNLANIRCSPTTFCQYATLDDFVAGCIATWLNGNYAGVLASVGLPVTDQLTAIGQSPWSADHYGNPPGSHLQTAFAQIGGFMATLDDIYSLLRVGTAADGTSGALDALRTGVLPPGAPAPGGGAPSILQKILDSVTATKAELDAVKTELDGLKTELDAVQAKVNSISPGAIPTQISLTGTLHT